MRNVRVAPVRWRRLVLAATAAVAVIVVPACTQNAEPPPLAESTASPSSDSPSPTPTPTPTPTPSQAPTATPTAAPTSTFPPGSLEDQLYKATVNFYSAVTEAYHVMDDDPIKPVIVPGSKAGSGYIREISELKTKKHRLIPDPAFTVTQFKVMRDGSDETEEVRFRLDAPAGKEVDANGKTVDTYPAGGAPGRIVLTQRGDKWLVLMQQFDS